MALLLRRFSRAVGGVAAAGLRPRIPNGAVGGSWPTPMRLFATAATAAAPKRRGRPPGSRGGGAGSRGGRLSGAARLARAATVASTRINTKTLMRDWLVDQRVGTAAADGPADVDADDDADADADGSDGDALVMDESLAKARATHEWLQSLDIDDAELDAVSAAADAEADAVDPEAEADANFEAGPFGARPVGVGKAKRKADQLLADAAVASLRERAREQKRAARVEARRAAARNDDLRRGGFGVAGTAPGTVAGPRARGRPRKTAPAAPPADVATATASVAASSASASASAAVKGLNRGFGIADVLHVLSSMKLDVSVYDVAEQVIWTDFLVVCTAMNERHLEQCARSLLKAAKAAGMATGGPPTALNRKGASRVSIEMGRDWTLIECGDIFIHFFLAAQRKVVGLDVRYAPYRVEPSQFGRLTDKQPTAGQPLVVRALPATETEQQRERDERTDAALDAQRAAEHERVTRDRMAAAYTQAVAEERAAKGLPPLPASATTRMSTALHTLEPVPTATGPFARPAGPVRAANKVGRGNLREKQPTRVDRAERDLLQRRKQWVDAADANAAKRR